MLNYFLRLRRKKGFTLVELIIVVAILAVLMASIAALSGPIRKMVSRTSASADAISANITMANYIENRLAFAAKMEIICAVDATDASGSTVNTTFSTMQTQLSGSSDKAGVLVFHYEEDAANPEESHYRIYDIPITSTSTNYFDAAIDSSGGTNTMKESTAVFADCFYDFSKNLFIIPTELTTNKVRNDVYMTVEVIPYKFAADMLVYDSSGKVDTTINQFLSTTTIPNYYEYKALRDAEIAAGTTPAVYTDETCGLSAIDIYRTGTKETATFELQNILTPTDTDPNPTLSGRFKCTNYAAGAGGAAAAGTDIMIFYYIPHY